MTYKADALEAWRDASAYSPPAVITPQLVDASPPISLVINAGGIAPGGSSTALTAYRTTFASVSGVGAGARAVASVFMHTNVINEFVLDPGTGSNTDWVITQPIKHPFFVTNVTARQPYSNVLTSSGACEGIAFTYFDREERTAQAGGSDFSPPGVVPASTLCWESTVLSIRNSPAVAGQPTDTSISGVLGSRNTRTVTVQNFASGWANLSFTGPGATQSALGGMGGTGERVLLDTRFVTGTSLLPAATTTAGAVTFFGLPVTGFAVRTFANGTLTCGTGSCQGNYGGLFRHSYMNRIEP
jgi:hypothetical protein